MKRRSRRRAVIGHLKEEAEWAGLSRPLHGDLNNAVLDARPNFRRLIRCRNAIPARDSPTRLVAVRSNLFVAVHDK